MLNAIERISVYYFSQDSSLFLFKRKMKMVDKYNLSGIHSLVEFNKAIFSSVKGPFIQLDVFSKICYEIMKQEGVYFISWIDSWLNVINLRISWWKSWFAITKGWLQTAVFFIRWTTGCGSIDLVPGKKSWIRNFARLF